MNLNLQTCEACRRDAPRVTEDEKITWLAQLSGWQVESVNGIEQLHKTYCFNNFKDALAFTLKIGELAEMMGHHPAILTEWGQVKVSWWTHKIKGLHKNDFICAAKSDDLI